MMRGSRLEVFKTLGDNTRYAIYLELARAPAPKATAEIAEALDLHPNTVRPHLERMREVGLLDQRTSTAGAVGRPQHLYSLAADAPALGLEPPTMPLLARMLLRAARAGGLDGGDAVEAGREQGATDATRYRDDTPCLEALMTELDTMGFDPEVEGGADGVTVAFTHCPFRELAEEHPEIVCGLHRGMVEGLVDQLDGGDVGSFHSLVDRAPCQVDLVGVGSSSLP